MNTQPPPCEMYISRIFKLMPFEASTICSLIFNLTLDMTFIKLIRTLMKSSLNIKAHHLDRLGTLMVGTFDLKVIIKGFANTQPHPGKLYN